VAGEGCEERGGAAGDGDGAAATDGGNDGVGTTAAGTARSDGEGGGAGGGSDAGMVRAGDADGRHRARGARTPWYRTKLMWGLGVMAARRSKNASERL
jgi:hypothetical protein